MTRSLPERALEPTSAMSPRQWALPFGFDRIPIIATTTTPSIQAKLKVGAPGDRYEEEADRIAAAVVSAGEVTESSSPAPRAVQRQCSTCATDTAALSSEEEEETRGLVQGKPASGGLRTSSPEVEGHAATLGGRGQPLPDGARAFFERRLGHDFGGIRIHADARAASSAQSLNALAYTFANHIVFAAGQYAPGTSSGRRLLAHELVHVVQQAAAPASPVGRGRAPEPAAGEAHTAAAPGTLQRQAIRERADSPMIARLSPSQCAPAAACSTPDSKDGPKGKFLLTIYADKEGPFLGIPVTSKVGHSWLRLVDTDGNVWTYGFWPQRGFDPSNIRQDVDGCVHHPDTAHKPTSEQVFELTAAEFAAAKGKAEAVCVGRPAYNLFRMQCTSFVREVLAAAGKAPALGFGLIWDSPNALDSWMRSNALLLGISVTAASSGPGGAGSVGLDLMYKHQFFSLLGNKLRLNWMGRGELGSQVASLSTGAGVDLTSQRVYLPSLYLFGGGALGKLGGPTDRFGAGPAAGAGLLFRIDELATVGVEYNLVKDLVNKDPLLQRLMFSARINLF